MSNYVIVSARQLQSALLVASKQDIRYYLNGVYIESGEGITRTVGTDGHMLLAHDWKHGDREQWRGSFIVPRETLETANLKVAKNGNDMVRIDVEDQTGSHHTCANLKCTLSFNTTTIVFWNVSGVFPDYTRVFPATLTHGEFWNCPSDSGNETTRITNLNATMDQSTTFPHEMVVPTARVERISEALNATQRVQQFASDKYVTLAKIGKVFSKTANFRMYHYSSSYAPMGQYGGAVVTFSGVPADHSVACVVMPMREEDNLKPPIISDFRTRVFTKEVVKIEG